MRTRPFIENQEDIMSIHTRSVGVIVARFQGATLHPGWRYLIETVQANHSVVLVLLGEAEFPTPRNPLSFAMRKAMIRKKYPNVAVEAVYDHPSDETWSTHLDTTVAGLFPNMPATLYGSRDSFKRYYSGSISVKELEPLKKFNGTAARKKIAATPKASADFRAGVIYAYETRLAVTRPMVDIAIINHQTNEVLLGGKASDPPERWRFPGGLVDPDDASLEDAARREAGEEVTGIEIGNFVYAGSTKVNDWRYRNSGEGGMTTLFTATYVFGHARHGDDLSRVGWFKLKDIDKVLVEGHKPLGEMLHTSLTMRRTRAA